MRILIILFFLTIALISGCSMAGTDPAGPPVMIVGHGGSGFETFFYPLPANTMESIKNAVIEDDADGVEMDIQITRDSVLVVFHDKELSKKTDCSGAVNRHTYAEIAACDFHGDFPKRDRGSHTIMRLDSVLQFLTDNANGKFVYLNIKAASSGDRQTYNQLISRQLTALLKDAAIKPFTIIESPDIEMLKMIKVSDASLVLMMDTGPFQKDFQKVLDNHLDGIVIAKDDITADQVRLAQQSGLKVVIYGLKTRGGIKSVLQMYPDAVQTDRINLTQRIFN